MSAAWRPSRGLRIPFPGITGPTTVVRRQIDDHRPAEPAVGGPARGLHGIAAQVAKAKAEPVWAPAALSYVWLSQAGFAVGAWDAATVDAERAVSLLEESGHGWLRPLARWAAVMVPAARGEWTAAEEHARAAAAQPGDYELMIAAASLAQAQLATARGDHDAVLTALEPLLAITPRAGVDEPGFWPWQDLYADALISAGRLTEAAQFLPPHEELAATRNRRSMIARLARARGRLEAARGDLPAALTAFQHGLAQIRPLAMPFHTAQLELAYGQTLRRAGQRRAAAKELQTAHDRFSALQARPYLEICDRELAACGLAPAKRSDFDPSRLTAQETAVARLVAVGMGNRQVAAELFVSIKTVQFHLTHIYTKLGISSRSELAAQFRDTTNHHGELSPENRAKVIIQSPQTSTAGPILTLLGKDDEPRRLTTQEWAVARLTSAGLGNRQVAAELFVSIKTVQFHLTHIYTKLGINSRMELVARFRGPDCDAVERYLSSSDAESMAGQLQSWVLDPGERMRPLASLRPQGPPVLVRRPLTGQESAVAQLIASGWDDRQIAAELFISGRTVQFHLTNIYSKVGVSSRSGLARQMKEALRDIAQPAPNDQVNTLVKASLSSRAW
jgi:DNA-binding NarL/FixJ family response regulator